MSLYKEIYEKRKARKAAEKRIERLCAIGNGIALAVAIAPFAIGALCLLWAHGHYMTYVRPLAGL